MAKLSGALVMVALAVTAAVADPPAPPAVDDAIKAAAAAQKPLVLEFSAAWCGPCKLFETTTLPDAGVQRALGDVVFTRYDVDVSPGKEAAERFQIDAYPQFLVLDRNGAEVRRERGVPPPAAFIEILTDAKTATMDERDVRDDLDRHPKDPAAHLRAGRWYSAHHLNGAAIAHYAAVAKDRAASDADRGEASAAGDHLERVEQWHQDLVAGKVALVRSFPKTVAHDDVVVALIDSGLRSADVRAMAAALLDAASDDQRLNDLIYIALAVGANDDALRAANQLVARTHSPEFLDTQAECYFATGDRAKALEIEDAALGSASGSTLVQLKRNRARYDSGTGGPDEVTELHLRANELWKRLENADQLVKQVPLATTPQPARPDYRKAFEDQKALAKRVATACAQLAGNSEQAIARVALDNDGRVTSTVVLVEESAKPKLRSCIARELAGVAFPRLGPYVHNSQLAVEFKYAGVTP